MLLEHQSETLANKTNSLLYLSHVSGFPKTRRSNLNKKTSPHTKQSQPEPDVKNTTSGRDKSSSGRALRQNDTKVP